MAISQEELQQRSRDGIARYWANITPEQRAQRAQRAAETCRLNAERDRERQRHSDIAERKRRGRINRAAATKDVRAQRRRDRAAEQLGYAKGEAVRRFLAANDPVAPAEWEGVDPRAIQRRADRFWAYVDRSGGPDACWPWHGAPWYESDYGAASWHGQLIPAHRVSWVLHNGVEIPPQWVVDHLCECKWCVNPRHCEAVPGAINKGRIHHRPPEASRIRTSWVKPGRWYPNGRRGPRDMW